MPAPVVITGSASGMGAATAQQLSSNGYDVIGVDRSQADVLADLGTVDGRHAAVSDVLRMSGGAVGAVVTFAGVSGYSDGGAAPVVSVNYFGTVDLLRGLRPALASSEGSAVAVASNAATTARGIDSQVVESCLAGDEDAARIAAMAVGAASTYSASKFALARWVRRSAPRSEWIGSGIRLNAIAPGYVETPMTRAMSIDPDAASVLDLARVPAGRPGRPQEIASLVAFLLESGSFFVGALLVIDGGTEALLRADDWPAPRPHRTP